MVFNYETIKQTAKKYKTTTVRLLALSPWNDPFYMGSKEQMKRAEWFNEIYTRMGRPLQCHIRRVHYWFIHQPHATKANDMPYRNTHSDWTYLAESSKYARYLNLIPHDSIIDQRNPDPMLYLQNWEDATPTDLKENIETDTIIDAIVDHFVVWNPQNTQPYHLEIWCEKSTMNDILVPIGKEWGINVIPGLGEFSITAINQLIKRIQSIGKPVRIFYISDFDPAGQGMPVGVGRKIEYFIRSLEGLVNVKLKPLVLTPVQCKKYDLPRTPIKEKEKRKECFEARYGVGATELDALEALYPGELERIILDAIEKYIDTGKWNEVNEKNDEVQEAVRTFLKENLTDDLEKLIDGLKGIDLAEYDEFIPVVGDCIDDDSDTWLYDSNLNYINQMACYKKFMDKPFMK